MNRRTLFAAGAALLTRAVRAGEPAENHPKIDPAKVIQHDRVDVTVQDFTAEGWILDVGGGGEGIIGRMKGAQVVAIDLSARELRECPAGPLKIVMDATELKFLDAAFSSVTAFYSLCYMKPEIKAKVMKEVARVLQPGGRFLVWDNIVPVAPDMQVVVYRYNFHLPKEAVTTGYGVFVSPDRPHDAAYYSELGKAEGLSVKASKTEGSSFTVEFVKA